MTTPDYDRYLDSQMEARFAETDAYTAWCEANRLDPELEDENFDAWEEFKAQSYYNERDLDLAAERFAMEEVLGE